MWLFTGNVRLEIVRPYARRHALSPIYTFPVLPARPYARSRARPYVRVYILLCVFLPLLFSFKKSCSATCLSISHLWKSFDISDKKGLVYLVRIPKSATFASAFENGGGDSLTFWQKRSRNPSFFLVIWCCLFHEYRLWKEKWKKTSDLFGVYRIKFLPLHPLSKWEQRCLTIFLKSGR